MQYVKTCRYGYVYIMYYLSTYDKCFLTIILIVTVIFNTVNTNTLFQKFFYHCVTLTWADGLL